MSVIDTEQVYIDTALPSLLQAVSQSLSYADEEILELARQADESSLQNQHYHALQQLRIQQHSVVYHFKKYYLQQTEPEKSKLQHINSLSKLLSQFSLSKTAALLSNGATDLIASDNIFLSYLYAISHTQLDLYNQVLLLRQFERLMQQQLPELQAQCYQLLEQYNIHPLKQTNTASHDTTSKQGLLLPALEQLKEKQLTQLAVKMQSIILSNAAAPTNSFDLLQQLEEQQLQLPSVNKTEQLALDNIQHLFSLIANNHELDLKARAMLLWLQLPYSCLALNNSSFLENKQNVPLYVLDEAIRLANQWPNFEHSSQLPALQQKLMQTILTIWQAPYNSSDAFQQILYDLLLFNDGLHQQQLHTNQQEQQAHSTEKQQQLIHQNIDETCHHYLSNAVIPILSMEIISQGWKPLMYQVASRYGEDSQSWNNITEVLQELANSLKPAEEYQSRNQFLLLLSPLVRKLRIGLSLVQSPSKVSTWLEQLAQEHILLAQKIPFSEIDDNSLEQARADLANFNWQPIIDEQAPVEQSSDVLTTLVDTAQEQAAEEAEQECLSVHEQQLAKLGAGSELNWQAVAGQSKRCRIAAYIKHTEQYILIYPNGTKAAEFSRQEMLEKLESGEIESLDDGHIFEDALATVIHGMRR